MNGYIQQELKRILKGKNIKIAVLINVSTLILGVFSILDNGDFLDNPNSINLIQCILGDSAFLYLLGAIVVALGYASSYIEDVENNFYCSAITRLGKGRYFFIKFILNGIVGGGTLVVTTLASFVVFAFIFRNPIISIADIHKQNEDVFFYRGAFSDIANHQPILFFCITLYIVFVFGFVFANIGLTASLFAKRKLIPIVFPFLFLIAFELSMPLSWPHQYTSPAALFYPLKFGNGEGNIYLFAQFIWIASVSIIYMLGVFWQDE